MHVTELDFAARTGKRSRRRRLIDGRPLLHHFINAFEGSASALHEVHDPTQRDHRPHKHAHVAVEHHEIPQRYAAGENTGAAGP
jgi:hypothetical protein